MERVKTEIKGLDKMLKGGIPDHHNILVCGGPGSGKTTFCFEYLYRGAKIGENGLFLSLEESPENIIENAKATFTDFNDINELVKDKKMIVIKPEKYNFVNFSDILQSYVTRHKVRRVVIDSATLLKLSFENLFEFRRAFVDFLSFLRNLNCSVLLTAEVSSPVRGRMRYELEHFVADGVIILYNLEKKEKRIRALEILKMRGTDHSRDLVPMKITSNGIIVFAGEKVY